MRKEIEEEHGNCEELHHSDLIPFHNGFKTESKLLIFITQTILTTRKILYHNTTRGTPAPATSKGYSTPPPLPKVVNGYPVNNNYTPNPAPNAAPAYYYYFPAQPAPTNPSELSHDNVTSFVPHGHDISEGLKPPNAYDNTSSIAGPDQPENSKGRICTCANPQLPNNNGKVDKHKNIGEKNGKKKNGNKKNSRSSGDSFKVRGNTINGGLLKHQFPLLTPTFCLVGLSKWKFPYFFYISGAFCTYTPPFTWKNNN
ncbi:unnamed protein product [Prunus armeniaca]